MRKSLQLASLFVVAVVLAGVAALYLQPDFVVTMANQVWSCF